MELFHTKTAQRDLELYSSQKHLIDTEILSISDEGSVENILELSPIKHKTNESVKKIRTSSLVEKIPKLNCENSSPHSADNRTDKHNLLSDSSVPERDESFHSYRNNIQVLENISDDIIQLDQPTESSISSVNSTRSDINVRKKKKNASDSERRNRSASKSNSTKTNNVSEDIELTTIRENKQDFFSGNFNITGLYIHKSSVLRNHPFVTTCQIVISIYGFENGKCLNQNQHSDISIHSHIWDSSYLRSTEPQWNELIIFENSLTDEMQKNGNIILFLQLYSKVHPPGTKKDSPPASELIAWCFLKPLTNNRTSYLNKKIKLQLYEAINHLDSTKIYDCWKNKQWKAYPGTLQVTLKGYKENKEDEYINTLQYSAYSLIKTQNINGKQREGENNSSVVNSESFKWREKNEKCQVFNSIAKQIHDDGKICFAVKFSVCGRYLAYALKLEDDNIIMVLQVPNFSQEAKLSKHKNIIYDLSWNSTSSMLISASSDCTVCIWERIDTKFTLLQTLIHQTFVYSAQFCEAKSSTIATGSFDKKVRIWEVNDDRKYVAHQELHGHEGFINALCFGKRGKTLYSGDSTGLIVKWNNENAQWNQQLVIKCSEIRGHIINDLVIFPNNQKLLIVLRNSVSWALDTSTSTIVMCFKDGISYKYQLRGCISPCGTLAIIGNCIWNAVTGQLLAIYNPLVFNYHTVTAVNCHPFYDMTAIACGFISSPILICVNQNLRREDKNLNIEIFKYENDSVQAHLTGASKNNLSEDAVQRKYVRNEKTYICSNNNSINETDRIHSSKLWQIINKMDMVISTVKKKGKLLNDKVEKMAAIEDDSKEMLEEKQANFSDSPQHSHTMLNKEEQDELKIDIVSEKSDGTYTLDNDEHSTLSEAESIHTYTVSPRRE